MNLIHTDNQVEVSKALAQDIIALLNEGKKVLWFIPGGSNIPISVDVMNIVRNSVKPQLLVDLTVTLTDERYGPVGHADSNWKQLIQAGFDFSDIKSFPILDGSSEIDTVSKHIVNLEQALDYADAVIAQFGIGTDGHIAGILPGSPAVSDKKFVCVYESKPFIRITITPPVFEHIDIAYAFAFGSSKREVIEKLSTRTLSVNDQPSQLLKQIKQAFVYAD